MLLEHWMNAACIMCVVSHAGQGPHMSTLDFINLVYKKDRLGPAAGNWSITVAHKKDVADMLENNHSKLGLPQFSQYLHSFKNGAVW